MKKINWGIIGLGNIAQSFSEGFFETENSRLLAVSSLNISKLEYFKKRFEINNNYIFKNYNELLACEQIDVVYIALPNNLHFEWIAKGIKNNKNILVEKPAFIKLEQADIIKNEIHKKELFFAEGYMYRYNPQIIKIIQILKNQELGKIVSMESSFCKNILTKKKFLFFEKRKKIDINNRLFNKNLGGGCILDLGCYPVSFSVLIASIVGGINYKKFKLKNIERENYFTDVDIDAGVEICFDNTFTSKVKSSFKKALGSTTKINCEKGDLLIENTWTGQTKIIKNKDGVQEIITNQIEKNIFSYEIENISRDIFEGKNKPSFPGVSIEETKINTEILESWLNG